MVKLLRWCANAQFCVLILGGVDAAYHRQRAVDTVATYCSTLLSIKDATTTITSTAAAKTVLTKVTAPPCTSTIPVFTTYYTYISTIIVPGTTTTTTKTVVGTTYTVTDTTYFTPIATATVTLTTTITATIVVPTPMVARRAWGWKRQVSTFSSTPASSSSGVGRCSLSGIPSQFQSGIYAMLTSSCSEIVQPKTIYRYTFVTPTVTSTSMINAKCSTTTLSTALVTTLVVTTISRKNVTKSTTITENNWSTIVSTTTTITADPSVTITSIVTITSTTSVSSAETNLPTTTTPSTSIILPSTPPVSVSTSQSVPLSLTAIATSSISLVSTTTIVTTSNTVSSSSLSTSSTWTISSSFLTKQTYTMPVTEVQSATTAGFPGATCTSYKPTCHSPAPSSSCTAPYIYGGGNYSHPANSGNPSTSIVYTPYCGEFWQGSASTNEVNRDAYKGSYWVAADFNDCLRMCDNDNTCVGITFGASMCWEYGNCLLFTSVTTRFTQEYVDCGIWDSAAVAPYRV